MNRQSIHHDIVSYVITHYTKPSKFAEYRKLAKFVNAAILRHVPLVIPKYRRIEYICKHNLYFIEPQLDKYQDSFYFKIVKRVKMGDNAKVKLCALDLDIIGRVDKNMFRRIALTNIKTLNYLEIEFDSSKRIYDIIKICVDNAMIDVLKILNTFRSKMILYFYCRRKNKLSLFRQIYGKVLKQRNNQQWIEFAHSNRAENIIDIIALEFARENDLGAFEKILDLYFVNNSSPFDILGHLYIRYVLKYQKTQFIQFLDGKFAELHGSYTKKNQWQKLKSEFA
jgi:hypothetical protein